MPSSFVLDEGGGVKKLAYGVNNTSRFHNIPSTHAEMEAMQKIYNWKNRPKIVNLVVVRYSKHGTLGESRPCFHCLTFLAASQINIDMVYYSNERGEMVKEKFSHMIESKFETARITSGMKHKIYGKGWKTAPHHMKDVNV
jgi:cytidine deaminase